ncbi:MAG: HEAT repeat domain-containing protein, partial [Planctomycetales bacterium]|nr:HEAT repeat domain-containing protein [Planctomycetales bacterium]
KLSFLRRQFLTLGVAAFTACLHSTGMAQTQQSEVKADALEQFRQSWNDERWEPPTGRLSLYMRPLNDTGWLERMQTLSALVSAGKRHTPALVAALHSDANSDANSDSIPVRALAAQTLGYLGDESARATLAVAVEHDPAAIVRLYAADSLGMLGGKDSHELLQRLEANEQNRDTKRHLRYAIERDGVAVNRDVIERLQAWHKSPRKSAEVGNQAPDFELTSLTGQTVRLSQYRGKQAVVLVFVYGDT